MPQNQAVLTLSGEFSPILSVYIYTVSLDGSLYFSTLEFLGRTTTTGEYLRRCMRLCGHNGYDDSVSRGRCYELSSSLLKDKGWEPP